MARNIGPKCRLCRREGMKLFLKGERCHTVKCAIAKRGDNYPPGGRMMKRGRGSEYGAQLRERQRLKRMYGMLERQFRVAFARAQTKRGNTGAALLQIVERRLDNVVRQGGFGLGPASARQIIVHGMPQAHDQPVVVIAILLLASVPVRLLIPNITGFLAITIPIAMAIGTAAKVNPVICGLAVMIAGDAVLYYPAQSASSLVVYERGYLTAPEIFRFGVWMTLAAFAVVLLVALPYWAAVGETLRML